jgi:Ca-activated chloride channel homolog
VFGYGFRLSILPVLVAVVLIAASGRAQISEPDVHIMPRVTPPAPPSNVADPSLTTHTKPYRSNVDLVLVPVTVTDSDDRLVTGLEKKNFVVYQDNEPQVLQHLSTDDAPISLGIIFDMSGSMKDKIENSRQAVMEFMKTANPQDEFFVIGFADRPELVSGFTTSIETIESQMAMTQAKGLTSLLDAIYLGLRQMKEAHNPRKALLIISDGGDNHSRYTENEVKSLVREADVQIYAIGLFDSAPNTDEERLGPSLLSDVTEATGGRVFTVDNPRDLADAATKIGVQLRDEYVLGYRPATVKKDGKWHKIKIKLIPPKGLPRLYVNHKKGFYAPPS